MENMEAFKCKGSCGKWKPSTSFYSGKRRKHNELVLYRDSICKECRFEERQAPEKKLAAKVRNAISNEADKLHTDSVQLHNWGVTFEYVKYLLERELALMKLGFHWCPNCKQDKGDPKKQCYKGDTPNPDDFTFDVIDPERMYRMRKLTRSNIQWICKTANWAKSSQDPTEYDIATITTYMQDQAFKEGFQVSLPKEEPTLNQNIRLIP